VSIIPQIYKIRRARSPGAIFLIDEGRARRPADCEVAIAVEKNGVEKIKSDIIHAQHRRVGGARSPPKIFSPRS